MIDERCRALILKTATEDVERVIAKGSQRVFDDLHGRLLGMRTVCSILNMQEEEAGLNDLLNRLSEVPYA